MAYTLSRILVGVMGGSSRRFARGASHQKCTASANSGAAAFRAASIIAVTAGVSGAGAAGGGCCADSPAPSSRRDSAAGLTLSETRIHGLHEAIGGPCARRRAVPRVVVRSRSRRLDLVERRAFPDHRLHTVADDRHHVPIF